MAVYETDEIIEKVILVGVVRVVIIKKVLSAA